MVTENTPSFTGGSRAALPPAPHMKFSHELFDTIDTVFLVTSLRGEIQFINRVCRHITGFSREEAEGRLFWDLFFQPSQQDFIQNLFEEALESPFQTSYEHPWCCSNGGTRLVSFTISAFHEPSEAMKCYTVTGLDVTKLRRMEEELWSYRNNLEDQIAKRSEELISSQSRLAGIVDSAEDAIISINSQQQIILFNYGAEKTFGYRAEEVEGHNLNMLIPNRFRGSHPRHIKKFSKTELKSKRMSDRSEISGKRRDGTEFPAEANISQVEVRGEKIYTVVLRDISERRAFEKQLKDSLNEKETLLREIHHRVKNNLQVISSLFTMQKQKLDDPGRLNLIRESQNRIQSMALIHEKMYQSHKLSQVCFDEYIRELVTDIFQSYEVHSEKIRLEFDLEPVSLDVNTAMPCALILNELTSNTLKYAFPESHKGTMSIVMRRISREKISLLFKDDGKGLPPEVDLENTKTLGLRLVRVLTRQLKGSVELTPGSGTSYNFLIPLS